MCCGIAPLGSWTAIYVIRDLVFSGRCPADMTPRRDGRGRCFGRVARTPNTAAEAHVCKPSPRLARKDVDGNERKQALRHVAVSHYAFLQLRFDGMDTTHCCKCDVPHLCVSRQTGAMEQRRNEGAERNGRSRENLLPVWHDSHLRKSGSVKSVTQVFGKDSVNRQGVVFCQFGDGFSSTAKIRAASPCMKGSGVGGERRNSRAGEKGDPLENPPTNGIVQHDSHMRKPGVTRFAFVGGEQANRSKTTKKISSAKLNEQIHKLVVTRREKGSESPALGEPRLGRRRPLERRLLRSTEVKRLLVPRATNARASKMASLAGHMLEPRLPNSIGTFREYLTPATEVCLLAAAPESSQSYYTPGSKGFATCFLACLLLVQSREGRV
ncbi:hypothetical protein PR048_025660 [Dryococelus australis]|uniref:Uncharacterized protein n=1 Tax=Dryococelus australis TaxID=614101 RepID=A0ABQ9GJ80_9NEOP|nr:hypothetical protein PR048_025660 [Dryococelus australis]